jgi:tetratricopeptide (TPR) repeat protein
MPRAKRAAEQALRLDPNASEAHAALGIYEIFYGWNFPAARANFTRALALNPNDTDALHFYSHYQEAVGDLDGAIQTMRKAVELDPYSALLGTEHGTALHFSRRYQEAVDVFRRTLAGEPGYGLAIIELAMALDRLGRPDEALEELRKADQSKTYVQLETACAHAVANRPAEARRIAQEMQSSGELFDPAYMAQVYAELGDTNQTLRWLDQAYRDKAPLLIWINIDPRFDKIKGDPRFQEIVARLKLG